MILLDPDEKDTGGGPSTPATDVKADSSPETKPEATKSEPVAKELTLDEVAQKAFKDSIAKQADSTSEEKAKDGPDISHIKTEEAKDDKEVIDAAKTKEEPFDPEVDKGPVPYDRFKEINETKKQFEAKVQEYEPMVQAHKSVVDFCQQNSISEKEFVEGLEFLRLTKTDPVAAKQMLQPIWDQLSGLTGDNLPADLAKEVEDALITPARAKELARFRGQQGFNGARTKVNEQQAMQARQQQFTTDLSSAIKSWSDSKSATDLTFKPKSSANQVDGKYEFTTDRFYKLMIATPPRSVAEAIKLLEQAHADVTKAFANLVPKAAPVASKGLSSTKSSSNNSKPPTTIAEVVQGVLARHKA